MPDYSEKSQTIRQQYVLGTDIGSSTIAWFSQGHLSHVDCVLDHDWDANKYGGGEGYLLGARNDSVGGKPPGVQIRPPDYVPWRRRVVMSIPCTRVQKAAYYAFLADQIGKPYDRLAILAFVTDRNWRHADSWICSELQPRAGEVAKILPMLYMPTNKITPVMSAVAFSAVGGVGVEFDS